MKYIRTVFILIPFLTMLYSCHFSKDKNKGNRVAKSQETEVSWSDSILNLGVVEDSAKVSFSFIAKNTGIHPLIFSKIEATCGCTVINSLSANPILPGQSDSIYGYINTQNLDIYFEKKIYVVTNTSQNFYILTLKGQINKN